jgi:hypothetical protein
VPRPTYKGPYALIRSKKGLNPETTLTETGKCRGFYSCVIIMSSKMWSTLQSPSLHDVFSASNERTIYGLHAAFPKWETQSSLTAVDCTGPRGHVHIVERDN